ncbi:GNAT family N-acetyltransferase [Asticcacaulis sp. EMRT-3]|uniref:GNAT family N-acetyltransferase n=1 Tax=Asticcacaulis sp. EMRT-3 TaxID=3040349 RepID=UPI0024AEABE9|nr:GNAT family N-acetyltransferase [Asticcacaulis sp. EMRT-3]MDI7775449.1 GNAT family N-acetyltransferase [Asticcacaulis sp. EMRT-3]
MLTCDIVKAQDVSARDADIWRAMLAAEPALASPLLTPDFVQAVAGVRDDVQVAVYRQKGQTIGFLPHHRRPHGFGRPVGAPFADYSALISFADPPLDMRSALRLAGLSRFQAIGLIDPHGVVGGDEGEIDTAYGIDLSHDGTLNNLTKKQNKNVNRLRRRLEEDHGEIGIIVGDRNREHFAAMLAIKRAQIRENGLHDFLGAPWAARLLDQLFEAPENGLHGCLITLTAGGKPVLYHYGPRLGARGHPWVSTFDPAYAAYSPGQVFLNDCQMSLKAAGLRYYDLSTGQTHYKSAFCNTQFEVRHVRLYGNSSGARLYENMALTAQRTARLMGQRVAETYGRVNRRFDQIACLELDMSGRIGGVAQAFAQAGRRRGGADAG